MSIRSETVHDAGALSPTLRIRDWSKHYENNRTRDLKRMEWVPIPNRMDGDGYTELVEHPNGAAHLGAWLVIVQTASKCDPRGTLRRDNGAPHTARSLARMSRLPERVFQEAIPRLLAIGWLESQEGAAIPQEGAAIPQEGAAIPQEGAAIPQEGDYGMEEKEGKERKTGNAISIPIRSRDSLVDAFQQFIESYPNKIRVDEACRNWISLIDVGEISADSLHDVLAGLQRWLESKQWADEDGQYIPSPAKWLQERRWKDDPMPLEVVRPVKRSSEGNDPYSEWVPPWQSEATKDAA